MPTTARAPEGAGACSSQTPSSAEGLRAAWEEPAGTDLVVTGVGQRDPGAAPLARPQQQGGEILHSAAVIVTEYSSIGHWCALAERRVVYYMPEGVANLAEPLIQLLSIHTRVTESRANLEEHVRDACSGRWSVNPHPVEPHQLNHVEPLLALLRTHVAPRTSDDPPNPIR